MFKKMALLIDCCGVPVYIAQGGMELHVAP